MVNWTVSTHLLPLTFDHCQFVPWTTSAVEYAYCGCVIELFCSSCGYLKCRWMAHNAPTLWIVLHFLPPCTCFCKKNVSGFQQGNLLCACVCHFLGLILHWTPTNAHCLFKYIKSCPCSQLLNTHTHTHTHTPCTLTKNNQSIYFQTGCGRMLIKQLNQLCAPLGWTPSSDLGRKVCSVVGHNGGLVTSHARWLQHTLPQPSRRPQEI